MAVRRSANQEKILTLLEGTAEARSAQQLYLELRQRQERIGLATVYRALEALKLSGRVQERKTSSGESLYSRIQEDRHHLTCLQCGQSLPLPDCPVHELERQLQQTHRFRVFYHTLEFFGLCQDCDPQPGT
jgi:Fur family ferric uptake transcriptional regulator